MPHTYECPMRWADMDMLGHVNNVRYLDYVAEARESLLSGTSATGARVARHQVEFAAPLVFRRRPVLVDSWFTEVRDECVTLAHEVYDAPAGEDRTVYLRVSTVLETGPEADVRALAEAHPGPPHAWRPVAGQSRRDEDPYRLVTRRSDGDTTGHARDVAFFEYFQESRIRFVMDLHTRGQQWSHHVVARTDIDFLRPLPIRSAPYDVHSWIGHVGTRSFTVLSELRDGEEVMATAAVVMVTFDKDTQRPADMTETQRERLLAALDG